jgi:membrane protein DedA with SNARE-associated domain
MDSLLELLQSFWATAQEGQLLHVGNWSYLILAFLVAVEGPVFTLIGASIAASGYLRADLVFVSAAAGNLAADALWYWLGYVSDLNRLARHGRWLGIRRRHVERLQQEMHVHARKILVVAKLTAGFVIPSLVAAGLARVSWRRWFPIVVAAEMVWTGALVLLGFFATGAIRQIGQGMEYLAIGSSVIFALVVLWLGRRVLNRREAPESDVDEADPDREG